MRVIHLYNGILQSQQINMLKASRLQSLLEYDRI